MSQECIDRLRKDPEFAVERLDAYLAAVRAKDPVAREILDQLRVAAPGVDLSGAITADLDGPGWVRSQLARMLMDPRLAKAADLRRLTGMLSEALTEGRLRPFGDRPD